MKKITRAGILSLVFIFAFIFTASFAEVAAVGCFNSPTVMQGIQIQARHKYEQGSDPFLDLDKNELTLKKGESYILKASIQPSGKSIKVDSWASTNPEIAKVSNSGKVTAVAPGTTLIIARNYDYEGSWDQTGPSDMCYVTVLGGSKDAKPLGTSDQTYYYGKSKFTVPTSKNKYDEVFTNVKKSIGGYENSDGSIEFYHHGFIYEKGLLFGSKDASKAHTVIYLNYSSNGFVAREKSPIKTNRGISVGSKKSLVLQKYGLPLDSWQYTEAGKTYEYLQYKVKTAGKNLYATMDFYILKSKGTVSMIYFNIGDI